MRLNRTLYMDGTRPSFRRGLLAGAIGGLVGTIAMSAFQAGWTAVQEELPKISTGGEHDGKSRQDAEAPRAEQQGAGEGSEPYPAHSRPNGKAQKHDGPTEIVASKIAGLARVPLSPQQKQTAGQLVHFAFGTLLGAAYGAAIELRPELQRRPNGRAPLLGLGYGGAVFVAADEVGISALGLIEKPTEIPLSRHIYGLASHLVYGLVVETTRRAVRKSL